VVSIPQIRGLEIDEPDDLTIARALVAVVEPAQVMTLIRPPRAVVFDFDGVMTDNLVSVDDRGREAVSVSRADGLAVGQLRGMVELLVLSTETSPVVERRCEKLRLACRTGIDVKLPALQAWLAEVGVDPLDCVYVGNDRNDLACMRFVGTAIAPADAESEALDVADVVLTRSGGKGAVREVVGMVLAALMER
jgi:N-acylneuraminate cytidylyltransferase